MAASIMWETTSSIAAWSCTARRRSVSAVVDGGRSSSACSGSSRWSSSTWITDSRVWALRASVTASTAPIGLRRMPTTGCSSRRTV